MNPIKKTMLLKKILITIAVIIYSLAILSPAIIFAQETETVSGYRWYADKWEVIPKECIDPGEGECNVNSFVQLFVNLAGIMLKILPSLAMLVFIAGGFIFISSGGKAERIQAGKRIMTTVIIGVLLVIGLAWTISYFTVAALTGDTDQVKGTIFPWQQKWWGGDSGNGGNGDAPPQSIGCCHIEGFGCIDQPTEEDCTTYAVDRCPSDPPIPTAFFQGRCSTHPNPCANYTVGCCEATVTGANCLPPNNETGCISSCGTTKWNGTQCENIEVCSQGF